MSGSLSRSQSCSSLSRSNFPKVNLTMSGSLSRSQSCCSLSRSGLEAGSHVNDHRVLLLPPSTDFTTRTVDEISGDVLIKRKFHEDLLALSTYLKVDENVDEFNFCCFCNIYFTVGVPIYSCVDCYMCMHQSCGELPMWIHSTRHPQHELKLTVSTTYADCVDGRRGKERILTTAYECAIKVDHFYHEHPLILSVHEGNERCLLCQCHFTKVETVYSCIECNFSLHKSCAGLPEFIKSIFHPFHLLMFMPPVEEELDCDECGKPINPSPRYTCRVCYFNLHFLCALDSYLKYSPLGKNRYLLRTNPKATTTPYLSRSLSFPMEDKRKSQIIFSDAPPQKDSRGISLTLSSFFNFQLTFAENANQIRHFSHEHPLVFTIFKMEYLILHSGYDGICPFCKGKIHPDDPIYGCHDCQFFLHESCAKLPQTMRSTLHPTHMLQLMPKIDHPDCQLCNSETYNSWNYSYNCDECAIYFHCRCVSAYSFEDHKAQEHTFHFVKPSIFTCDVCGITETKERFSCLCTNCQMQVHKQCSNPFPRTLKQKRHHHKLNLTYFFEVDFDYANETCKLCFNPMNKVYCLYQCHECTYIAHVKCATSKYIIEDESVVNNIGELVITEVGEELKVEHFSHAHPLVFTKEEPTKIDAYCDAGDLTFTEEEEPTKFEAFCDACVSPISAPFYACTTDDQCNFYLHKRCFELPLEIQHPLHVHRLTLTSENDIFKCYGCGYFCNGFKYSCGDCWFHIDVRCSLLSDTLKHDGHDCTLTLIDYSCVRGEGTRRTPKCSVCDGYWKSSCRFSCKRCNFHLDLGCASLPKSVTHECPKHDWKAHPLQLTYGGIPDASGIYFCDTCEESRVLSNWFYDCDDCVWSNHPKCVLGEFQFKYGKTYKIKGHDHTLELVKKPLSRYNVYSCDDCKEPLMDDSPLFCAECNLYFHRHVSEDSESVPVVTCGIM